MFHQMDVSEILDTNKPPNFLLGTILWALWALVFLLHSHSSDGCFMSSTVSDMIFFPKLTNSCSGRAVFAFCCHVLIRFFRHIQLCIYFGYLAVWPAFHVAEIRMFGGANPHIHGMILDSPQELYLLFFINRKLLKLLLVKQSHYRPGQAQRVPGS